ncbi:TerB family tellurite resistance protein [Mangrovivirga sp. M17]|uniref:TerB family tellurite resistance protein n=1 Tax=Mangrovivirga halotolerans TaxID=2993936 RepID=A0ABT3RSW4_9BACT|nr:TerB family tellurite resistance protein [Mangrovivirga halotolerans]MCX2744444.1 TerB family tellurite resistance protein [Mangrovivirga halotolerans]
MNTRSENSILIKLYYLTASADGRISENEKIFFKAMCEQEEISDEEVDSTLPMLMSRKDEEVMNECIKELKSKSKKFQIEAVAWMATIANSDGFMAQEEWQLIYRLYNKEFSLDLSELLLIQKKHMKYCLKFKSMHAA